MEFEVNAGEITIYELQQIAALEEDRQEKWREYWAKKMNSSTGSALDGQKN